MPSCPLAFATTAEPATATPLMPAIKVLVWSSLHADANRVGFPGNAYVTDVDIVIAYSEIASSVNAHGDVRATGCVTKERGFTVGCVVVAGCIAKKRVHAIGRIVAAGDVLAEHLCASGRVIAASGVVLERSSTVGRVEVACRIGEKRLGNRQLC